MHRRTFLASLSSALVVLGVPVAGAAPQDVEFIRAWERAQRDRPRVLSATSRLAPAGEPGTPLLIHGRVFQRDGRTPAPDIVLFGYHTDAGGHYDVPGAGPHSWRLRGWIKTGTDGRFEIATIRPAPYPNRRTAAHVHWSLEGPGLTRRSTPSLQFTDDDLNTADDRRASARAGRFGWIRPVVVRDGVQHVDFNIRIADTGTF